jgi:2-C-methyl-D-erythritol 4-phosphate cytidylyltransferase/2-C-methyl-D-erythritol 2,4-cyclodiphosphate synthase
VHVTAIIAAGGRGARFGDTLPKQFLPLAGRPILQRSIDAFTRHARITEVIVALPAEVVADPPDYLRAASKPLTLVEGGARRQDSVWRAFARVSAAADIVVVHDAARPLVNETLIGQMIDAAAADGAAIAALPVTDTVKRADAQRLIVETVPRGELFLAQTPQAFRTTVLREALALSDTGANATDEAALVERMGFPVRLVDGDPRNLKITTADDLAMAERLLSGSQVSPLRIGAGYDIHRLVDGRPLILGGVVIPFERGLAGHSDADAVCHAVTDALLGAAAVGDIGRHFPDTDPRWKDADSVRLLARAVEMIAAAGYGVVNVDVVVIAERPTLAPYVDAMRETLARALGVTAAQVGMKGKTNEGLGSIGAGESIAVHAVALLCRDL